MLLLDNSELYLTKDMLHRIIAIAPEATIIISGRDILVYSEFEYSDLGIIVEQGLLKTRPGVWEG